MLHVTRDRDTPGVSGECHVVQCEQVHGGAPPVHRPGHSCRLVNGWGVSYLLNIDKQVFICPNEFSNIAKHLPSKQYSQGSYGNFIA